MRLGDLHHLERWLESVLSNTNPLDRKARNAFSECLVKVRSIPTEGAMLIRLARRMPSSMTGIMCGCCYSDLDSDACFCKYCGARIYKGDDHEQKG